MLSLPYALQASSSFSRTCIGMLQGVNEQGARQKSPQEAYSFGNILNFVCTSESFSTQCHPLLYAIICRTRKEMVRMPAFRPTSTHAKFHTLASVDQGASRTTRKKCKCDLKCDTLEFSSEFQPDLIAGVRAQGNKRVLLGEGRPTFNFPLGRVSLRSSQFLLMSVPPRAAASSPSTISATPYCRSSLCSSWPQLSGSAASQICALTSMLPYFLL